MDDLLNPALEFEARQLAIKSLSDLPAQRIPVCARAGLDGDAAQINADIACSSPAL